jgi:hypothetical protein
MKEETHLKNFSLERKDLLGTLPAQGYLGICFPGFGSWCLITQALRGQYGCGYSGTRLLYES